MTKTAIKTALGLAVGGALLASPAQAKDLAPAYASDVIGSAVMVSNYHDTRWNDRRYQSRYGDRYAYQDRRWDDRDPRYRDQRYRDYRDYRDDRRYDDRRYDERRYRDHDYRDQRNYRDEHEHKRHDEGKYCRKTDGGTGTIIGGAVGAILGREIDKHGDRTLGTVIGAAGGALIGRELEKGRCR